MPNNLPRIAIDEDINDADWIKRNRWDLPTSTGPFLRALGVEDTAPPSEKRRAVVRFMQLPASSMMPASLRRSLRQARLL